MLHILTFDIFQYFLQLIFRLTPLTSAAKSNKKLVNQNYATLFLSWMLFTIILTWQYSLFQDQNITQLYLSYLLLSTNRQRQKVSILNKLQTHVNLAWPKFQNNLPNLEMLAILVLFSFCQDYLFSYLLGSYFIMGSLDSTSSQPQQPWCSTA